MIAASGSPPCPSQHETLDGKRYRVVDVPYDGNCLFSAISCGMYGSPANAANLRQRAVTGMELFWGDFEFFTYQGNGDAYPNYEAYRESMSSNGTWGSAVEAHVLALGYDLHLSIYEGGVKVYEFNQDQMTKVNLLFVRRMNHYRCLVEIEAVDDSEPEEDEIIPYPEDNFDVHRPNPNPRPDPVPYDYDEDMFADELPLAFKATSSQPRRHPVKDLPTVADRRSSLQMSSSMGDHYLWAGLYSGETAEGTPMVSLGEYQSCCPDCNAYYWEGEKLLRDGTRRSWCCGKTYTFTMGGSAKFKDIVDERVQELYTGNSAEARHFQQNIIHYNNALSCAVPVTNYSSTALRTGKLVVMNGRVSFECDTTVTTNHADGQLFFAKMTNEVINRRLLRSEVPLRRNIMVLLERYLREHNDLMRTFEMAAHLQKTHATERVSVLVNPHRDGFRTTDREGIGMDANAMRPPGSDFVAAVFFGEALPYRYDVALFPEGGDGSSVPVEIINENSPSLDTLLYPLIHLHAEDPWVNMDKEREWQNQEEFLAAKSGTRRDYYSSRIVERPDDKGILRQSRGLFQQWIVDAAVKIEDGNLRYAELNNDVLRVCQMDSLRRFVESECEALGKNPGRVVIIPPNIKTSERAMLNSYLDSVRIATETNAPSMLATFTTNPRWPEITERLQARGLHWDEYVNAPDVVVRVYLARLYIFLSDLAHRSVLGRVIGFSGVHEFTTTGLPHFHFAVILDPGDIPTSPDDVDAIVSAEIPSFEEEPETHTYVMKNMIHRPCDGSSPDYVPYCRKDGGPCKAGFPFDFREETLLTNKGPKLRRREARRVYHRKSRCYVDNRWVVPFNAKLGLRHGNHLNIMLTGENLCFKYLFGYFAKTGRGNCVQGGMLKYFREGGRNAATPDSEDAVDWNEIEHYQDLRVIGPFEAMFKILGEPIVRLSHSVENLPIHLPDKNCVYYRGNPGAALDIEQKSMLMGWFELNQRSDHCKHLLYSQMVIGHRWENRQWIPRKRGTALGRLMVVNPTPRNMELFYLRLLLLSRPGMKSFHDLLTVNGESYTTFHDACIALGLGETHSVDYAAAMEEVVSHAASYQIRTFFATILATCHVDNGEALWLEHRVSMSRDYLRRGCGRREAFVRARRDILRQVESMIGEAPAPVRVSPADPDGSALQYLGREALLLPVPVTEDSEDVVERVPGDDEFADDLPDDVPTSASPGRVQSDVQLSQACDEHIASYNAEQRAVHDQVMAAVLSPSTGSDAFFSLMAPAGCGKTYLYRGLVEDCRRKGLKTVCCAMTALAAQLLPEGDTCHKVFGIPVKARQDGTDRSFIERISTDALRLRNASLILVDEVSMMSGWQAILIDSLLRDIMERPHELFGGKVILLGGDMGQILPVMRNAGTCRLIQNSLPRWQHWPRRIKLCLTVNMRARDDPEFAAWVLRVRDGSANVANTDNIRVPRDMIVGAPRTEPGVVTREQRLVRATTRDEFLNGQVLVNEVFGSSKQPRDARFRDSIIVSPTNNATRFINHIVLQDIETPSHTYLANTKMIYQDGGQQSEAALGEFVMAADELENINASNLPPHNLTLKIGCVVMLLINLDKRRGLCNGSRFTVTKLLRQVICLKRLNPLPGQTDEIFLPKMTMRSDDVPVAGSVERYQFPVALAFAVTINKSQGQTFDNVGVFLRKPVFSHGQFHVAVGRAKTGNKVKICVMRGSTQGPVGGMAGGPTRLMKIQTKNIVFKTLLE